ncbi:hypothetical protein N3K66_000712 [Trichothecium roseum]|uniref:Uncharacterized protein n=1 Tax=Trichothecium roseum TaxID=47278 RepID=A0ACC0VDI8_9HYPO|nr:hypothetical protein N3K66_000712 [Trichothecium roseum]
MSIDIWPPIPPASLEQKAAETRDRELEWFTSETIETCRSIKHGLDDCYALLAPVDPGSTLVMSTPRAEKVKGTLTRVGTRIVKGSLSLRLATLPAAALHLSSDTHGAVHIHALDALHAHLTESIDLLSAILGASSSATAAGRRLLDPHSLYENLSVLSDSIAASIGLLKGPPVDHPDPAWQTSSCPPQQFSPQLPQNVSFYVGLQECCVVLWLRALEPAHAPVHLGMKLGLAIGTVRRLEHDEMDTIFKFNPAGSNETSDYNRGSARHSPGSSSLHRIPSGQGPAEEVLVREKVRIESADPSLISLHSKLVYLRIVLGQARRNLSVLLDIDAEDGWTKVVTA